VPAISPQEVIYIDRRCGTLIVSARFLENLPMDRHVKP